MLTLISWPEDKITVRLVGNKAANLSKLHQAGIPTPNFFCVTTQAYRQFVRSSNLHLVLGKLKSKLDSSNLIELTQVSNEIYNEILSTSMADHLVQIINSAVDQIRNNPSSFAVRSSAIAEDVPERSFAGLYRTFLNVKENADVLNSIKKCWASLWTVESVFTRHKLGIRAQDVSMAVLVQVLIESDISGVIFTESPIPSQSGHLVINAAWGLGEGVVSGSIPADTYVVDRNKLLTVDGYIANKNQAIVSNSTTGIRKTEVEPILRKRATLDDNQIIELCKIALDIESLFGTPQDIEWGYKNDRFYVLQSRPIAGMSSAIQSDEIIKGIKEAVIGKDREAHWVISNNIGAIPLTPFSQSVWSMAAVPCEKASEILAEPKLSTWGIFNDFIYLGERPITDSQQNNEQRKQLHLVLVDQFADKWETEFRTEVEKNNDYINNLSFETSSLLEIVSFLKKSLSIWQRHWEIHNLSMNSKKQVAKKFSKLFNQLFGPSEWRSALQLLQGFENVNLLINHGIWELSEIAKSNPKIMDLLKITPSKDSLYNLRTQGEATEFLNGLMEFLSKWGNRIVGPNDFMHPSWKENPTFLFQTIIFYAQTEQDDPFIDARKLAKEREDTESKLLKILSEDHQNISLNDFIYFLHRAQTWPAFLEDHNYLIEQTLISNIRRIALEIGLRFQSKSVINEAEDILYVTIEQIESIIKLPELPDLHNLVRKNKKAYESKKGILIPQTLDDFPENGTVPERALSKTGKTEDILSMNFYPDPMKEMPARLLGIPAAPGYARGPARVINDIDEFSKVKPGDILICQRTTPPWTPLFSIIAGIVTNAGSGVLQHSAINAREFGIPAVLGTKYATEVINSGQLLAVDGTQGVVEFIY